MSSKIAFGEAFGDFAQTLDILHKKLFRNKMSRVNSHK